MIKIFKNNSSKLLYIETVTFGSPEDFIYSRNGNLFTIDRINTNVVEVNNARYSIFTDVNGVAFNSADEFETYLTKELEVDELATISDVNNITSADGSVNSHSDIDLSGVSVFKNSLLKYDGTDYVPCLDVLIDAPNLVINNTNQVVDVINTNIDIQRLNPHKITISYGWSLNDAGQDFESFATFGGQDLNQGLTDNNPIHAQEPKDTAGSSPDGRGTNQMHGFSRCFIVTPTSLGLNNLILQMSGGANGDLASIWDVKIEIEEYINVNNL